MCIDGYTCIQIDTKLSIKEMLKMTKIEKIQKKRKEKLSKLSKDELVKKIMDATLILDAAKILLRLDCSYVINYEGGIKSLHETLTK
jgi:hypothetical protein